MELKSYIINDEISEKITRPIPQKLIRERDGGRAGKLKYITGYTVVSLLNRITNYAWDWKIKKYWLEESPTDKYGNKSYVYNVIGTLTVNLLNEEDDIVTISKDGVGSKISLGGKDHENALKAATTDALKKAASYLGIGAALYLNEEENDMLNDFYGPIIWTKELKAEYKEEWQYINYFKNLFNLNDEELNDIVYNWSENTLTNIQYIEENNIKDFVEYLKIVEKNNTTDGE